MNGWPNSAEDRMLGDIGPPAMRDDFAARIMARISVETVPPLPELPRRRDPRGRWKRAQAYVLAGAGAGLLSVAAAATGMLGVEIRNLPVISSIAAVVAPAPKPEPKPKRVAVPAKPKPAPVPKSTAERPVVEPPEQPQLSRQEIIEKRLEAIRSRRDARREARGLPPLDPKLAEKMDERFKRRAEARAARRDRWQSLSPEQRAAIRERRQQYIQSLSEEERAAFRERRRALLERRREAMEPR